jgi:hypothetical protein
MLVQVRKGHNPLGESLHIDGLLTPISIGYRNSMYIAGEIFPDVIVNKRSDLIPKYDQSHWFRDAATLRAPGTKSVGGGFTVGTQAYFAQRYSYRFEITDEDRDNTDAPFDLDRDGALFVADKIMLRKEKAFVDAWFKTGVWGVDKVGTTDFVKWSDYGGSAPLLDLATWQEEVSAKIAVDPMHVAMGSQVWASLKWHPDMIDTVKYTQVGKVSIDTLITLSDLTRVHVGRALITASPEGTAEASVSYTRLWGDNLLLYYRPERPSLFSPCAGYNFVWGRVPGASMYTKRFRDEERETDIIEGNTYFDYEQTSKNAGLFVSDVL